MVSFAQILFLTGCIMVINGQLERRVGSPNAPPNCAAAGCPQPSCTTPVVPLGECCPVCPTLPDQCAAVLCAQPECSNSVTPPGQCCPVCPGSKPGACPRTIGIRFFCIELCKHDADCGGRQKCCSNGCSRICELPEGGGGGGGRCDGVKCPTVRCADQYKPPGECCPVCKPKDKPSVCRRVRCKRLIGCADEYIPKGECCPVCRNGNKCHRAVCRPLRCRNRYTPTGKCCPVCRRRPRPDCSRVTCKAVSCRGMYIPLRGCCPVCPRYRY